MRSGKCGPNLPVTGKGWREDPASGFIGVAGDVIPDVRQGHVLSRFADVTPGFGTYHPQDRKNPGQLGDPYPIPDAYPIQNPECIGPAELGYTDKDVEEAARKGVPLKWPK